MNDYLPRRKVTRLKNYDYSKPGFYSITICAQNRKHLFGEIVDENIRLSKLGEILEWQWNNLPNHFSGIEMDQFVVMPNHIHGIIHICNGDFRGGDKNKRAAIRRGAPCGCPDFRSGDENKRATTRVAPTIGDIIGAYKSLSACNYLQWIKFNKLSFNTNKIWQRNYWEHVIRNDNELNYIRDYIQQNPQRWQMDKLKGACLQTGSDL